MDSEKAFFRLIYIEDEEISTKTASVEAPGSEKNAPAGAKRRLWKPLGVEKTPPQGRKEGCGSYSGVKKNAPAGAGRQLWKPGDPGKTPPQGAAGCGNTYRDQNKAWTFRTGKNTTEFCRIPGHEPAEDAGMTGPREHREGRTK